MCDSEHVPYPAVVKAKIPAAARKKKSGLVA